MGVIIIIKQVVKIGGSLFPENAIELAKKLKNTNSLIILGGGEFANLIRKYDSNLTFSSKVTHYTAIDCMDIIAKLVNDGTLARECPNFKVVQIMAKHGFAWLGRITDFMHFSYIVGN